MRRKPPVRRPEYGQCAHKHAPRFAGWRAEAGATTARIGQWSSNELLVNQGSLYPALYRLQRQGRITSEWKITENNRRARYYRLTATGRKQLASEHSKWDAFVRAMGFLLKPTED